MHKPLSINNLAALIYFYFHNFTQLNHIKNDVILQRQTQNTD